jgi:hypothetical protein
VSPLRVLTQSWREVTLICHHGQTGKRERELHARSSGYEPDGVLLLYPAKVVPREVLAPSSPALQAGARAISAIEGQMVSRAGIEPARRSTGFSAHACLPNSTTWTYWCPPRESNSHAFRAAVFEPAASACSARRAKNGAAHRSRTCTDRLLSPDPLPIGVLPRLPRRESNAQGCV